MTDEEKTEIVELMDELWDESEEGAKCAIFSVAAEDGLLEELRAFLKANRACTTEDALNFVRSYTEDKPFLEELRRLLEEYKDDEKPGTYNEILTLLFDGIRTDERIYVPLVVDFKKRDTESGLQIRLGYDMSEYEWTEPLVLAGDMDRERALEILHRLCVDGESTNTITEIECFKRFKEDSGRNR